MLVHWDMGLIHLLVLVDNLMVLKDMEHLVPWIRMKLVIVVYLRLGMDLVVHLQLVLQNHFELQAQQLHLVEHLLHLVLVILGLMIVVDLHRD
jgi:hypothetical protein